MDHHACRRETSFSCVPKIRMGEDNGMGRKGGGGSSKRFRFDGGSGKPRELVASAGVWAANATKAARVPKEHGRGDGCIPRGNKRCSSVETRQRSDTSGVALSGLLYTLSSRIKEVELAASVLQCFERRNAK